MLPLDALQQAIELDTSILLYLNGANHAYFDHFMSAYSGKWIWIPLYASLLYVMLRNLSLKQTCLCVLGLALTITFADQLCATLIRPEVERLRPSNLENPLSALIHVVNGYRGGSYGFPSCHAANTFGLAFFVFFLFKQWKLTLFMMLWALLTCYSRMYLGVHYPGDLLAGMLVGLAGASLMYFLFTKVSNYRPVEKVRHAYVPILTGVCTIMCIGIYSAEELLLG